MRVKSLEAIAEALRDAKVPFLVVGGLAVVAHGYGRMTQDVDIVTRMDSESLRNVFTALGGLGYRARVPVTANQLAHPAERARLIDEKKMTVLAFFSDRHPETPVDLFVTSPFDFDLEYQQALQQDIAPGLRLSVVQLGTLLSMKRLAGRPQDLADIAELEALGRLNNE